MRHWSIAVDREPDCAFIGLPSRCVDGSTLQEVAGEQWSQTLLGRLLPPRQVWAWWTRTFVFKQSKLNSRPAPDRVDITMLDHVQARRLHWCDMTLAFIPIGRPEWQQPVLEWAGLDTDRVADQIWVAPRETVWEPKQVATWCRDEKQWRMRRSVAAQPAELIVVIHDSNIYCACREQHASRILGEVRSLAADWNLQVVSDAPDRGWPELPAER